MDIKMFGILASGLKHNDRFQVHLRKIVQNLIVQMF